MGNTYTSGEGNSSQLLGDLLRYHNSHLFPFANSCVGPYNTFLQ